MILQAQLLFVNLNMGRKTMDAEKTFFENYSYVLKIVRNKTSQYGLDYDECFNFVLNEISRDNHKKIKAYRGECKFSTFITVVVNRLIISFARKNKILPEMPTIIAETPLDILIEQQQKECKELFTKNLPGLLKELSFKERLVLKMRYFKDFTISQISNELSITRYEINKMLNSSIVFLREKIKEICKK